VLCGREAIEGARHAKRFGVILGTLGRQGSNHIFRRIRKLLNDKNVSDRARGLEGGRSAVLFLMAELNPIKIATMTGIDVSAVQWFDVI
jgi:diphthamide biosynthesis enzyme Dph1/Dph2-like protein